jgi:hypothetical protein
VERLTPSCAVCGGSVDKELEERRIDDSARALTSAKDFVPRRGELVNSEECELRVRDLPPAIAQTLEERGRYAGPEGSATSDRPSARVGDLGEVRRVGVEGVRFSLSSRARGPCTEGSVVGHGFGFKTDRLAWVEPLGDPEMQRDVVSTARLVPASGEGLIPNLTVAVAIPDFVAAVGAAIFAATVAGTIAGVCGRTACSRPAGASGDGSGARYRRVCDRVTAGDWPRVRAARPRMRCRRIGRSRRNR